MTLDLVEWDASSSFCLSRNLEDFLFCFSGFGLGFCIGIAGLGLLIFDSATDGEGERPGSVVVSFLAAVSFYSWGAGRLA